MTVGAIDTAGISGTVTLAGGTVSYDPNGQFESLAVGETAVDTFTYTMTDGNGGTDVATVNVTITGENDAPVAADDNATFGEDDGVSVLDLVGNDTDPDGSDTLTVGAINTAGTTGTVTLSGGTVSYDPNSQFESLAVGETAVDTFTYTVTDGNGGTDVATVNVTITGENDVPVAADDNVTFGEDDGISVLDLVGNDTDPDGSDTLTVGAVNTAGTTGTVNLSGGTVLYDPNGQFESLAVGETAIDTFTYTMTDGNGGTDVATVNVTITGGNDVPVAADDSATFGEDDGISVLDLVGNDTDPDGSDALTVGAVNTASTTGSVTLSGGTVSYDPNGQFESFTVGETAVDTFTYTVDGNGGTDVATVNVTITGSNDVPIAADDNATFGEDDGVSVLDLVGNDTDPDGSDTLTVGAVNTVGTIGTVTLSGGTVSYDPNAQFESLAVGETAVDTFNYTVTDGNGGTDVATVNVTITGANDVPVAADDNATFGEDDGVSILDLVGNDIDADGSDTLTVGAIDTVGISGTVTLAGGTVSYDPNGQFESLAVGETAVDTFTYTVTDGNGGTDVATVNVTITGENDVPVAADDNATFGEDDGVSVLDLVGNDTDPDGSDTLTVGAINTAGTSGTVNLSGGTVSYDPNGQFESLAVGETAIDSFTYTVTDGNGGTDVATVNVTITGANDVPVAADDNVSFSEDDGVSVLDLGGNDTDPDGSDTLTVGAVNTVGTTGTVTLSGGTVSYDPNSQFESLALGETAVDSFTYTVTDGNGGTDIATVNVTITGENDVPVAADDNVTFGEDDGVSVLDLVGNDTDADGSDTLTVGGINTAGTTGTVALSGGTVSHDPNGQFESLAVGETAIDSFTYTVTDGNGGTDVATVNVTITGANDVPVAADDNATFGEDDGVSVLDLVGNDTDPDGSDTLTVGAVNTAGTTGTVTLSGGIVSYDPNGQFESLAFGGTAIDSFTYTVTDGNGGTDVATVNVTITGANDVPVAADDNATFGEDDGVSVLDLVGNDTDPDGSDTLTVGALNTAGTTGTVTLSGGTVSYDPNGQFESLAVGETAIDSFTYTVTDGNGGTDVATVNVTITGENDIPVAVGDNATFGEDDGVSVLDLIGNDIDPDGSDGLSVGGINTAGTTGTVTLSGGTVSYDPSGQFESLAVGETAIDSFRYTITDGNGGTDVATVNVTITGENDAPVAADDNATFGEDDGVSVLDVLANDIDSDASDTLLVSAINTTMTSGSVTLANGTVAYDPNGQFDSLAVGETAIDFFTYTVTDGNGGTDVATATLTITGMNDQPSASDDAYSTSENTALNVPAISGILTNDSDPDSNDLITANPMPVSDVTNGTLTINNDGSFDYVPDPGFTGVDSFTYLIEDPNGGTDTATVSITVLPTGVNNPPVAVNDNATFAEDDGASVLDLVANDTDPDVADTLTVGAINTSTTSGLVTLAGGTVAYDPNGQFEGLANGETALDSFTYTVTDGSGGTDIATVNITISGLNDAPEAIDDNYTTAVNTALNVPLSGSILVNDSDADTLDSFTLDSSLVSNVTDGTLSLQPDGSFTYIPNIDFVGNDSFTYRIIDGNGATDIATVTINVTPQTPAGGGDDGSSNGVEDSGEITDGPGETDVLVQEILLPGQLEPSSRTLDPSLEPNSLAAPGAVVDTVRTAGDLFSIDSLSADGAVLDAVRNASPEVFGDLFNANLASLENAFETQTVQGFSLRLGLPELGGSLAESITSQFPLRLGVGGEGTIGDAIQEQLIIESLVQENVIYIDIDYETGSQHEIDEYLARLANGDPLPEWLKLDTRSGLLIGDVPIDAERIELRLEVHLNDGTQIVRYVQVQLSNGEISELIERPEAKVTGIIPFTDSLTAQQGIEETELSALLGALGDR